MLASTLRELKTFPPRSVPKGNLITELSIPVIYLSQKSASHVHKRVVVVVVVKHVVAARQRGLPWCDRFCHAWRAGALGQSALQHKHAAHLLVARKQRRKVHSATRVEGIGREPQMPLDSRARQFLVFRTTPGTPHYSADLAELWAVAGSSERQGILRQHVALLQQLKQDEVPRVRCMFRRAATSTLNCNVSTSSDKQSASEVREAPAL